MVYAGLLTAIGIVLPQAFHIFGEASGGTFLPIHLPVLMAGLMLGPWYGAALGVAVPLLGSLLTGMPAIPRLYFMVFELAAYGLFAGILIKKFNVYIALILSMILGRIVYACILYASIGLFLFQAPFANRAAFLTGIITGIPGMVIQIMLIPVLYRVLKKGGYLFEEKIKSGNQNT